MGHGKKKVALGDAELISCKSHFFGDFGHCLKTLYTITVELLEYQQSGHNSIFTLSIFYKTFL